MRAIFLGVHLGLVLNDLLYDIMSLNGDVALPANYYASRASMSAASEYLRHAPFALSTVTTVYACFKDPQNTLLADIGAAILMGISTIGTMSAAIYRAEVVNISDAMRLRELLVRIGQVNVPNFCILFTAASLLLVAERQGAIAQKKEEELAKMKIRLAAKGTFQRQHKRKKMQPQQEEEDYRLDENELKDHVHSL